MTVKVITGDNGRVAAQRLRDQVGLAPGRVISGQELGAMSDEEVSAAIAGDHDLRPGHARTRRRAFIRRPAPLRHDVGFLGDGVNDAVALHARRRRDLGRVRAPRSPRTPRTSSCSTKNLGILADGVVEGRRIFANTIKYVLMGTSSNFGNMFSTAGASLFLPFLPMLPTQILLNNLLYDVSEMTIPTDNVDEELVARPAQWDIGLIRRFMFFFGPISSIYDFLTFGVMLRVFHAGQDCSARAGSSSRWSPRHS